MDLRLSVTLACVLLLVPSATAAWSVKGAWEPDTLRDVQDGWMRLTPDTSIDHVVYFNGFVAGGGPVATSANPNVATLGSAFQPSPLLPVAMMGLWRDCNQDGYVGLGDNGLLEYRAELLADRSVCPPAELERDAWRSHHTRGWVVEFVPIGYDDTRTSADEDPLNLNDTSARVWADRGLPGEAPALACATLPAPRGTFRSTGGMLAFVDCFTSHRIAGAVTLAANAAGHPELGFGDAPEGRPDRSASPLNVQNPWGDASDGPMARAVDCSEPEHLAPSDPTDPGDGSGALHSVSIPLPDGGAFTVNLTDERGEFTNMTAARIQPSLAEGGSPAGTMNETQAATDCDREDPDEIVDVDGERTGSDADLPYAFEGPADPLAPHAPRTRTDHVFSFEEGLRGRGTASVVLGDRARDDAGSGGYAVTGFWVGDERDLLAPEPYVSRGALGPAPVTYLTYYGWLSSEVIEVHGLKLPQGLGIAEYAVEGCERTPVTVACDPEDWWRGASGEDLTPRDARLGADAASSTTPAEGDATRIGVRIGQPYRLRDVDCIDSSVAAARPVGGHWGTLSGTRCDRPSP